MDLFPGLQTIFAELQEANARIARHARMITFFMVFSCGVKE
jgi:hypothetical protein